MAVTKRKPLSNSNPHPNNYLLDVIKSKKAKIPIHPDWSSMHPDLLEEIFNCLHDLKDKVQAKNTCSSWYSASKSHIRSFIETKKKNSPMLFISSNPDEIEKHDVLFSLEDKTEKPLLHNVPKSYCIGSSSGWILMLGKKSNLFIFHRVFGLRFPLPPIQGLPGFDYHPDVVAKHYIKKFILWGDPFPDTDFGVAVIHGRRNKIAFFKNGDTKWTESDDSDKYYSDILYHDGSIFALTSSLDIEKYKVFDVPRKLMHVKPSSPDNITESNSNEDDLYSFQSYLVESRGDLLAVVRCIGNYVYGDNEVIREADLIEGPYNSTICAYKTINFYVYKLNLKETAWEELGNVDDQMLFIGGNQSFSLSAKNYGWGKENSIYFTDDNWLEINIAGDNDLAGHDMGIFCLRSRSFDAVYVSDIEKLEPAFWVTECL